MRARRTDILTMRCSTLSCKGDRGSTRCSPGLRRCSTTAVLGQRTAHAAKQLHDVAVGVAGGGGGTSADTGQGILVTSSPPLDIPRCADFLRKKYGALEVTGGFFHGRGRPTPPARLRDLAPHLSTLRTCGRCGFMGPIWCENVQHFPCLEGAGRGHWRGEEWARGWYPGKSWLVVVIARSALCLLGTALYTVLPFVPQLVGLDFCVRTRQGSNRSSDDAAINGPSSARRLTLLPCSCPTSGGFGLADPRRYVTSHL